MDAVAPAAHGPASPSAAPATAVKAFSFGPAQPNPFHDGITAVTYSLPQRARVRLDVLDRYGQRLRTLVSGVQKPGQHKVSFHLQAGSSRPLPGGVYTLEITAGREHARLKVLALDRDPWVGPIWGRRPR